MNNIIDEVNDFKQSTPPETPPEFPFTPAPFSTQSFPVPMVYVDQRESFEYRVEMIETVEAKQLETELNQAGTEGWRLIQIIPQEKRVLVIFSRRLLG